MRWKAIRFAFILTTAALPTVVFGQTSQPPMAAEVLAHLEATKDYGELNALYNRKTAADPHWLQSAEGRAVDAQLKKWRNDAAATAIIKTEDGRVLQYSIGGVTARDYGISVADLEKSRPYRQTIAEAIAQNILTGPLDPKVKAALASSSDTPKVIKDPAEYKAYMAAFNKTDPAEKASAMEAFLNSYPNSVVKLDALEQAMVAYQQAGSQNNVESTARRILVIDNNNVRALAVVVFIERTNATSNGQTAPAALRADAERGLAAMPTWTRPEGTTDADFVTMKNQMVSVFAGAAGFAALEAKDYVAAQKFYEQAVAVDPADLQTVYQLSIAELEQNPLNPAGFWHVARAMHLADAANNPAGMQAIERYGKARYVRFHGGDDGWDVVVKQAAATADMPKDFAVKAAATLPEIAVQAVKDNDLATLSFADMEFVLSQRDASPANQDAAERVWQFIQSLQANGARVQIHVKVITATATAMEVAISEDNQKDNKTDMHVVMANPLTKPPVPGSYVDVTGQISEYTPSPFKFTMTRGEF